MTALNKRRDLEEISKGKRFRCFDSRPPTSLIKLSHKLGKNTHTKKTAADDPFLDASYTTYGVMFYHTCIFTTFCFVLSPVLKLTTPIPRITKADYVIHC